MNQQDPSVALLSQVTIAARCLPCWQSDLPLPCSASHKSSSESRSAVQKVVSRPFFTYSYGTRGETEAQTCREYVDFFPGVVLFFETSSPDTISPKVPLRSGTKGIRPSFSPESPLGALKKNTFSSPSCHVFPPFPFEGLEEPLVITLPHPHNLVGCATHISPSFLLLPFFLHQLNRDSTPVHLRRTLTSSFLREGFENGAVGFSLGIRRQRFKASFSSLHSPVTLFPFFQHRIGFPFFRRHPLSNSRFPPFISLTRVSSFCLFPFDVALPFAF